MKTPATCNALVDDGRGAGDCGRPATHRGERGARLCDAHADQHRALGLPVRALPKPKEREA